MWYIHCGIVVVSHEQEGNPAIYNNRHALCEPAPASPDTLSTPCGQEPGILFHPEAAGWLRHCGLCCFFSRMRQGSVVQWPHAAGLDGTVKNHTLVPLGFYTSCCVVFRSFPTISGTGTLNREVKTLTVQLALPHSQLCLELKRAQLGW